MPSTPVHNEDPLEELRAVRRGLRAVMKVMPGRMMRPVVDLLARVERSLGEIEAAWEKERAGE